MTLKLAIPTLLDYLNEKQLHPTYQKEYDQIYITLKILNSDVPIFFVIKSEILLQTIAYLPYDLPEKTFGQVARLLHLINRELDMPGFGMDEKQSLIFFRSVLPGLSGELDDKLLELTLSTTSIACETFMKAIALIASGKATVDELMKDKQ